MPDLDAIVYGEIVRYDTEHGQTIDPKELLFRVRTAYPHVPELAWRESAIRMYRKRGAEQQQEADELWLYGQTKDLTWPH